MNSYSLANAAPFNIKENENTNSEIKSSKTTAAPPKRNVTFKNRHENAKPKIQRESIEDLDAYKTEDERINEYLPKEPEQLQQPLQPPVQQKVLEEYANVKDSNSDKPITKDNYAKLDSTFASDYYKQFSPYQGSYQAAQPSVNSNYELLKKLDNILHLLEEQQEEKTNLITEELILYVFLGIFVIYVLDSFVKVGKYTR